MLGRKEYRTVPGCDTDFGKNAELAIAFWEMSMKHPETEMTNDTIIPTAAYHLAANLFNLKRAEQKMEQVPAFNNLVKHLSLTENGTRLENVVSMAEIDIFNRELKKDHNKKFSEKLAAFDAYIKQKLKPEKAAQQESQTQAEAAESKEPTSAESKKSKKNDKRKKARQAKKALQKQGPTEAEALEGTPEDPKASSDKDKSDAHPSYAPEGSETAPQASGSTAESAPKPEPELEVKISDSKESTPISKLELSSLEVQAPQPKSFVSSKVDPSKSYASLFNEKMKAIPSDSKQSPKIAEEKNLELPNETYLRLISMLNRSK